MGQTCSKCSRVNPEEASYCYHDGAVLPGHGRNGGPVSVGSQPFATPLVFPSGRRCRNFDELALGCQEDWAAARDLLRQGFLASFLGGLGRADLAQAAREAARFPDPDRGLDQLLVELPTSVLQPPRLRAGPQDIHLGVVAVGQDRGFELHLENQGMRLLYGSVTCDDGDWLSLGDPPGSPEKLFQFGAEAVVPVHVRGKRLRAGSKPLEGRLLVESNGGTATVTVKLEVPPKPFPDGVLAGAVTPRQVAEKAKAAPKEAAAFFESGAVARWYRDNGWTYPVQGPPASGLGAVQQFFEALGVTKPPKVGISARSLSLSGAVGDRLEHTLEVKSEEKRPVYAHAVSNQPWLEVGRARLNGRVAVIPLVVPAVPDREGETLTGKVVVQANGNQRFVVPVTLAVGGNFDFTTAASEEPPAALPAEPPDAEPAAPAWRPPLVHLVPAALLLLALGGLLAYDAFRGDRPVAGGASRRWPDLIDAEPRLGIQFDERGRFGLTMLREPDPADPERRKRLTFEEAGGTGNVCVKIDGYAHLVGQRPGRWAEGGRPARLRDGRGWEWAFEFPAEGVVATQKVELVPGEQTRLLDTCLVRYSVKNRSAAARKVGLRVLLDTFIGANDGVPFVVPGRPGLLEDMQRFPQKDIPDFIQALERPDLKDPGTVAHLALKLPGAEPVETMLVAAWPGNREVRWDWEPRAMNENPQARDSSVALYWAEREMNPGEVREMAYAYGLNAIAGEDAQLALTAGGDFRPDREFTVTAYVKNPQPGQVVRLALPEGFRLADAYEAEQKVAGGGDFSQASWKVRAGAAGDHVLEAASGGARATYKVKVRSGTIY
jgi:hypothetical protein